MRYRRVVCFLLGVWLGVSAMLAYGVYRNFDAVESMLKSPPDHVNRISQMVGQDNIRMLLRYAAGVENADTFETWENIQFGLGLLVAVVLFLSSTTRALAVVPLIMLLLLVFLHFKITPELAWLGRTLEFLPLADGAVTREHFWNVHRIYGILEIVKCVMGLGLLVFLVQQGSTKVVRRRHRAEGSTPELDRHVTRG